MTTRLTWPLCLAAVFAFAGCGAGNPANANNAPSPAPASFGADKVFAEAPTDEDIKGLAAKGRDVFGKYNCISCHALGERRDALNGPPLARVGARYRARYRDDLRQAAIALFNHMRDPEAYPGFYAKDPAYLGQKMPAFPQMSDAELRLLVHFLLSRR